MKMKELLYEPIEVKTTYAKVECNLSDDGTLWIKTDKLENIKRVIVEDGKTFCKTFYQD